MEIFLLSETKSLHYKVLTHFDGRVSLKNLVDLIATMTALSVGLWMQTLIAPQIAKVYDCEPELKLFAVNFDHLFQPAALAILNAPTFEALRALRKNNPS